MYTISLAIIICTPLIVLAALAALIYLLVKPGNKTPKAAQSSSALKTQRSQTRNWQIWFRYFFIALLIAIWTIWGALFFLAVVWIMRLNPEPYSPAAPTPSDLDKDSAKGVYTWLLISPALTLPTLFMAEAILGPSINDQVLAALIPLIFHIPLLFRLNKKQLFIYRHTQLAILLVALRAGMTALALNTNDPETLFLLGNGSLWLFGTMWARNQVIRGECWLMQRKGETIIMSESVEPDKHDIPIIDKELAGMLDSLNTDSVKAAKEKALHAFQTGTPTIKKRAVAVLAKLDEVEKF